MIFYYILEDSCFNSSNPPQMHKSIADQNPYQLFILTKVNRKNFTRLLLTIGHMSMFVVKPIVIQINGQGLRVIDLLIPLSPRYQVCHWVRKGIPWSWGHNYNIPLVKI